MRLKRNSCDACADLDVDCNIGGEVIVREPDDLRWRCTRSTDPRIGDPFLRRNSAAANERRMRLSAELMQIFDRQIVGEDDLLACAMQPMRPLAFGAVPEFAEARLGDDGVTPTEGGSKMSRISASVMRMPFTGIFRERCDRRFDCGADCIVQKIVGARNK
jgi:hypothetical protein